MRRIVVWLASTVTIVVLLFGYHTSTNHSTSTPGSTSTSGPTPTGGGGATASKAYTGSVAQTRWGPVQVKITVTSGKVVTATVLQQPSGNPRDTEINDYALPILIQETVDKQSADIDMVSGATVTSDGYVQSLQAALDAAGI